MTTPKPTLPEDYVVPTVWEHVNPGGAFGGINQPTAGARTEKELRRGKHELQLYSLGTPNGQKVTILLEELSELALSGVDEDNLAGFDYDAWKINIMQQDQFTSGFVAINPNSKIPALLDHGQTPALRVFESASILKYVAERHGSRFIPKDLASRTECYSWLFWQMGTAPYIGGGLGHFYKYAPVHIQYCIDRFAMEAKRILDVLDKHLAVDGNTYVCGEEYTIADMAILPWVRCIETGYAAQEFVGLDSYKNVARWRALIEERPAVKRGIRVNGFRADAVVERHSHADFAAVDAKNAGL